MPSLAILYICAPIPLDSIAPPPTAESLLRPYLTTLLTRISTTSPSSSDPEAGPAPSQISPLFEIFYIERLTPTQVSTVSPSIIQSEGFFSIDDSPSLVAPLTETSDLLSERAERTFWEVCGLLARVGHGSDASVGIPQNMWDESATTPGDNDDVWD